MLLVEHRVTFLISLLAKRAMSAPRRGKWGGTTPVLIIKSLEVIAEEGRP